MMYKLIGKLAVPCSDPREWIDSFESNGKTVAETPVGRLSVSTVFLGFDHNFDGDEDGDAILFETQVYIDNDLSDTFGDYRVRYCTWGEAEKGHAIAIEWAQKQMAKIEQSTTIPPVNNK